MKKQTVFCGLFLFTGLLAAGCRKAEGPTIATVGSSRITGDDLRMRLVGAPNAYRQYAASPEGRRQFLNLMIREKILLEEAKSLGITRDSTFKAALAKYKAESDQRVKDYEDTLLVESALRRLRSGTLAATDTDVEKFYNDHLSDYAKPVEVTASHILVSSEGEAQMVLSRLKDKEPFDRLAKSVSKDPATAVRGGKLAPFRRGMLVPEFEAAVFPLKVGAISGPVKTQFGFHIIKKLGEKMLPPRSLPEVKDEIRVRIEKVKFDEWVASKEASLKVKVNEEAISGLSLEETQKP